MNEFSFDIRRARAIECEGLGTGKTRARARGFCQRISRIVRARALGDRNATGSRIDRPWARSTSSEKR